MRELGGYIEFEKYTGQMLYEDGIKLNCGRNALSYLIKTKKIEKIWMPKFMCDSCDKVLLDNRVKVEYYSIGNDFRPIIEEREKDWLYIVNFYAQLSNDYLSSLGDKIIVDNAQAYFQSPIPEIDTIYTCRKFFGVPDGAILYTDKKLDNIPQDESFERMRFLLGRFERTASEFYAEYVANNHFFENEPIKKMSKLTENLLHGINYEKTKNIRTENFKCLHSSFEPINKLKLKVPEGAFMYPLYIDDGEEIRRKLQAQKIFVPTLWPSVFSICDENELEYNMAKNILPLPVDQRYSIDDMEYMVKTILSFI